MLIPQFQPLVNLNLEASGSFLIRPGSDEVVAAGSRAGGDVKNQKGFNPRNEERRRKKALREKSRELQLGRKRRGRR